MKVNVLLDTFLKSISTFSRVKVWKYKPYILIIYLKWTVTYCLIMTILFYNKVLNYGVSLNTQINTKWFLIVQVQTLIILTLNFAYLNYYGNVTLCHAKLIWAFCAKSKLMVF